MKEEIEYIREKNKIDSEISIFWDKMSEYLPKSFERSALGDEKIFIAFKQAYIEFRPFIADEVLKVVVRKIKEKFPIEEDTIDETDIEFLTRENRNLIRNKIINLLSDLSPNKENLIT